MMSTMSYNVKVSTTNETTAIVEARGHRLSLDVEKGGGKTGINAAETLLASLAACLMTNILSIGKKKRLRIERIDITVTAERLDDPPLLRNVSYQVVLVSPEPDDKLQSLYELAMKWGTVYNTLADCINPSGVLQVKHSAQTDSSHKDM